MPNDSMPNDPISAMVEGAIQLHELRDSYVRAGFSPIEAMMLVQTVLAAAVNSAFPHNQ